jgi:small subunit ribosomal protein S9
MPAKKQDPSEEKEVKAVKKPAAKKSPAKVAAPKAEKAAEKTPAAKKTTPAKAAPKAAAKTAVKKEEAKPAVKAAKPAEAKKTGTLSKQKARKLRIEDKFNGRRYYLGVGKRKTAVALVRLHEKGKGQNFVNNTELTEFFFGTLIESALSPLELTDKLTEFDITVKVEGGGVSAQADAVRHGIARALVEYDAELRPVLKKAGLLTRDARMKERKKPGLKRARRAPQWRKR